MKVHFTITLTIVALAGLLFAGFSGTAWAGEAHVCHSKPVQIRPTRAHPQPAFPRLTDKTQFVCRSIGTKDHPTKTIPELAEAGWSITQITGGNGGARVGAMIFSYTLVIQKK